MGTQPHLIQFPSGRWGFVGKVDARLAYVTQTGEMPTPEQLQTAAQFGARFAGLTQRAFETPEAARAAAEILTSAHRCALYINARGETIDPADQNGIGCPICQGVDR